MSLSKCPCSGKDFSLHTRKRINVHCMDVKLEWSSHKKMAKELRHWEYSFQFPPKLQRSSNYLFVVLYILNNLSIFFALLIKFEYGWSDKCKVYIRNNKKAQTNNKCKLTLTRWLKDWKYSIRLKIFSINSAIVETPTKSLSLSMILIEKKWSCHPLQM